LDLRREAIWRKTQVIIIDNKKYKLILEPEVIKDVVKGKASLEAIRNTLLSSKKFPEFDDDNSFFIENSEFDAVVCGYKSESEIRILMATYREHFSLNSRFNRLYRIFLFEKGTLK